MKRGICKAAAALAAAALLLCSAVAAPSISAQSAAVMDATTGRVLWEHNADNRALIASTTKIMTALLVAEECDLESKVAVSEDAVGIEGSSIYLKAGEILTVEALLYGMMLHSGNDAAAALALYCAGTMENFVEKMNNKADALGLHNTHFANAHGLDSVENYSTARDLAHLAAYAMRNPIFYKVASTKSISFDTRTFTNHNKLLWKYKGAVGVKTGYTMAAGRILVSCAERDGRRVVAVTISDPNDWNDHCSLLDCAFSEYTMKTLVEKGITAKEVPVVGGADTAVFAVPANNFIFPVAETECVRLVYHTPLFVFAPVVAGDQAGELSVLIDEAEVQRVPLYWQHSVLEGA